MYFAENKNNTPPQQQYGIYLACLAIMHLQACVCHK